MYRSQNTGYILICGEWEKSNRYNQTKTYNKRKIHQTEYYGLPVTAYTYCMMQKGNKSQTLTILIII